MSTENRRFATYPLAFSAEKIYNRGTDTGETQGILKRAKQTMKWEKCNLESGPYYVLFYSIGRIFLHECKTYWAVEGLPGTHDTITFSKNWDLGGAQSIAVDMLRKTLENALAELNNES